MCKFGEYIRIEVKCKDLGDKWGSIDSSNSLQGGSCYDLWCSTGYLIRYDSCFLLKDRSWWPMRLDI